MLKPQTYICTPPPPASRGNFYAAVSPVITGRNSGIRVSIATEFRELFVLQDGAATAHTHASPGSRICILRTLGRGNACGAKLAPGDVVTPPPDERLWTLRRASSPVECLYRRTRSGWQLEVWWNGECLLQRKTTPDVAAKFADAFRRELTDLGFRPERQAASRRTG